MKNNKGLFISAYVWMFGYTKKQAADIYKNASKEYIDSIIESYLYQCQLAFSD